MKVILTFLLSALSFKMCPHITYLTHMDSDTAVAREYYNAGVRLYNMTEFDSSIVCFDRALVKLKGAKDKKLFVESLFYIIRNYNEKGHFEKSEQVINNAEQIINRYFPEDKIMQSTMLYFKGNLLQDKGKIKKSVKYIVESIKLREQLRGKSNLELSYSYHILGFSLFLLFEFEKALQNFERAINIRKSNGITNDIELVRYLRNKGMVYYAMGESQKAMENYDEALSICNKINNGNDRELGAIYTLKGVAYMKVGDYQTATNYLEKAERIYIEKYGSNYYHLSKINSYLGLIHLHLNNYNLALERFKKNIKLQIGINKPELISTYYYCAMCCELSGLKNTAKEYYKLYFSESSGEKDNILQEQIPVLINSGMSSLNSGDTIRGLNLMNQALTISQNKSSNTFKYIVAFYIQLGNHYLSQNKPEKSLQYFQFALKCRLPDFDIECSNLNTEEYIFFYQEDRDFILYSLAEAIRQIALKNKNPDDCIRDLKLSFEYFKTALEVVENLSNDYQSIQSKLIKTNKNKNIYTGTISCLLNLYAITGKEDYRKKAFEYAEKGKASVLLSTMRNSQALTISSVPDSLQRYEKQLKQKIAVYRSYIYAENQKLHPDMDIINNYKDSVFALSTNYEELVNLFEKEYPAYYSMKYNASVIKSDSVQAMLMKDQALIEYVISDSLLYIFVVTKENYTIYERKIDHSFFDNIETVKRVLRTPPYLRVSGNDAARYKSASYNLYQVLIEPFDSSLNNNKLIIVPDEALGLIPFETLLTENTSDSTISYNRLPYLLIDHCISYTYSATLLYNETRKGDSEGTSVLAFAADYQHSTTLQNVNATNVRNNTPDILQRTLEEAKTIFSYYNGTLLLNKEATEDNFKKHASTASIIHLALHTKPDNLNPMYFSFVFSLDTNSLEDGYLNAYEIYTMRIEAEMAVLSGCSTGSGEVNKGEGIMSIARSFIYAGCQSLVTTLWTVPDDAGCELMQDFYKYLASGLSKDEALRMAKLEYLSSTKKIGEFHPHYWAGYIVHGNTDTISGNKTSYFFRNTIILVLSIIVTILTASLLRSRRRKKSNTDRISSE